MRQRTYHASRSHCTSLISAAVRKALEALIEQIGFFGIELGTLAMGVRLVQFPGRPLPVYDLVRFG